MSHPLDIGNPILDVEKALTAAIKEFFPSVPYRSGGARIEKPIYYAVFKHNDYFENPFQHVDMAQLPSISLSLIKPEPHRGHVVVEDEIVYSEDPNAKTVIIKTQPELYDLHYNLNFLTDNSKVLSHLR
jgi:hypothetical protein